MDEASEQVGTTLEDRIIFLAALDEGAQQSRTLVEALPEAILIQVEHTIVFINPSCLRLFGAEAAQQILRPRHECRHPSRPPGRLPSSNRRMLLQRNSVPFDRVCSPRL